LTTLPTPYVIYITGMPRLKITDINLSCFRPNVYLYKVIKHNGMTPIKSTNITCNSFRFSLFFRARRFKNTLNIAERCVSSTF